mgnify:CR=1 FL=1|tara:strand:- start:2479 stop:3006 length:528 start_codon:yes stop_codon:yes gene_type:complete
MKENSLESNSEQSIFKKKEYNNILLFGIGIFSWLAIGSFAYLSQIIMKNIFFNFNANPIMIIWTIEVVRLLIYGFGILYTINKIKENSLKDLTLFRNSILFLILGQILQFLTPFIMDELNGENYLENAINYNSFMKESYTYLMIPTFFGVLTYIVAGLIIYSKRNMTKITVPNNS